MAPPVERSAMEKEPWKYQGEISNIVRPGSATLPAELGAAPFLPLPIGSAMRGAGNLLALATNPRIAGPIAGGVGFLGGMTGGSEGEESPVGRLNDARAKLMQRQNDVYNRREAERIDAPKQGPKFRAADAEYRDLQAQIISIDEQIKAYGNSPEHQLELSKKADEQESQRKTKEAATPFRERYPGVAGALPWIGVGASLGLPLALKGKANLGTFTPSSYASRLAAATKEAETAIAAGDFGRAKFRAAEIKHLLAERPTIRGNVGKAAAAAAAGGGLAAEGNLLPDQIDAFNLPEGEAKERARARTLDPRSYAERGAIGMMTGLSGYKAAGLVPSKEADIAKAKAVIEFMSKRRAPKTASPNVLSGVKKVTRKPRGKAND